MRSFLFLISCLLLLSCQDATPPPEAAETIQLYPVDTEDMPHPFCYFQMKETGTPDQYHFITGAVCAAIGRPQPAGVECADVAAKINLNHQALVVKQVAENNTYSAATFANGNTRVEIEYLSQECPQNNCIPLNVDAARLTVEFQGHKKTFDMQGGCYEEEEDEDED
jgi:hypothetical protein